MTFIALQLAYFGFASAVVFGQSTCPPLPGKGSFSVPGGTKVYYTMNLSGLPNGSDGSVPANEVKQAIAAWNSANQASGNYTQFLPAGSGNPVSVNFTWSTTNNGDGALTSAPANGLIDSANPATVTFYPDSIFEGTTVAMYQSNKPGYGTAYLQTALHEIGHLMGIGDYDVATAGNVPEPQPGSSVMNGFWGVNDTMINPPLTAPTKCDAAAAAADSHVTLPGLGAPRPHLPPPSYEPVTNPGGSGDGSFPSACGGGSYFDPDTNTVYGWC